MLNAWLKILQLLIQFQGKYVMQAVQKAGEAIYLPYGTPHTVHNLEDNVAFTENYLFVDAVPGKKTFSVSIIIPVLIDDF